MNRIYRIFGLGLMVVCAIAVWAAPARRGWVERLTEDGSTVRVQQMGDEFYHYWINEQGEWMELKGDRMVATGETVTGYGLQVTGRRAAKMPQAVGTPTPIQRVLVILASYSDIAIQPKNTAAALDSLFNYPGYNYNNATGSVRDYFTAQSDSQYMPVFDVVGPVTLPNNRKYYGENSSGDTDRRAGEMIKDACKAVDAFVNFADYDSDGNGTVDAVYVIYAGIGANDNDGVPEAIWPHMSYTSGLKLDGKSIYAYICSGEIDGVTKDRTGIGPICHEFSHAIGMPDYYSTGNGAYIIGEWSAMDYGMYNNDANTPPNYSIFDKQFMGWKTIRELKADQQANISLTTDYADGYKLTAGGATYYIENRQLTGWDIGLPGSGMLVWQVKYDKNYWNANQVNATNSSPRYSVLSAAKGILTTGEATAADPYPGSQNVTGWTKYAGFAMTEITETDGLIQFKLNGGKTTCTYEIMAEHCDVPEDGVLALGNTLSLTILPETGYTLDDADCWAVEMGSWNPLLEYGVDYTYDAQTGEFRIESVTDDVVIIVEAKEAEPTGVDIVESRKSKVESRKMIRNGQMIIIRGDKRYNAQGIEIQ